MITIWDILEIDPTSDKRVIKKAYAARVKEIHPEEKPEEFQMLYKAYQAAMKQVQNAEKRENDRIPGMEGKKEDAEKKPGWEDDLLSYFEEQKGMEKERVEEASESLKNLWRKFREPEEKEKLTAYFRSEAFRSVQWHPQVVRLLAREFPKLSYSQSDVWQFFWELYGFQEEKPAYEEAGKFWDILNAARKQWEQEQVDRALYERRRQEEIKLEELLRKIRWAVCILVAILFFFLICHCVTADQRYIAKEMAEKYPGAVFSKPRRGEKDEEGTRCYNFTSSVHPDMEITACVKRWTHNSGHDILIEDYGAQVLGSYAEQYGIKVGVTKNIYQWESVYENFGILYYPAGDLEQLNDFSEKVCRMFQEHEELQLPGFVGICMEDALYEEAMMARARADIMLSDDQFFRPWEMTEEELAQKVKEAYIEYMFNYEPWKLTLQRYRELGPKYEQMCGRLEGQDRWYDLYVSGERICGLCIRDFEYYGWKMSVGNAYYYLLLQEADISVPEDGTGFDLREKGETIHFGEEPYLEFHELEWRFSTFSWDMEDRERVEVPGENGSNEWLEAVDGKIK